MTEGATAYPIHACILAPMSKLNHIRDCAAMCSNYVVITAAFKGGKLLQDLPPDHPARRIKDVWHRLSLTDDNILMVDGTRIYIPLAARAGTLNDLHCSHCGFVKTVQTARGLYYWPSLRQDLKNLIENCEPCQTLRPSKPAETLINTTASFLMEKISMDLYIWIYLGQTSKGPEHERGHNHPGEDHKSVRHPDVMPHGWRPTIPLALQ